MNETQRINSFFCAGVNGNVITLTKHVDIERSSSSLHGILSL